MSEVVEPIGKPFFAQYAKYGSLTTWENLSDDARHIWVTEIIPAVIASMEEPINSMINAATDPKYGNYVTPNQAAFCWQIMIQSLLHKPKGEQHAHKAP
jgi:hypothetical protein